MSSISKATRSGSPIHGKKKLIKRLFERPLKAKRGGFEFMEVWRSYFIDLEKFDLKDETVT